MGRIPAILLALVFISLAKRAPAAPANLSIHSPNRQHRLDFWNIERGSAFHLPTDSAPYNNSVTSIITDEKSGVEMKRKFYVAYPELLTTDHVLLSENARAVLVLPGPLAAPRCDLHLLFDTNNPATSLNPYSHAVEAPSFQLPLANPFSVIDRVSLSESVLPVFDRLNNESIVRIWEATTDRWIAYNFRGEKIPTTPALTAEWNSKSLDAVRARIHARESVETREKLSRLKTPLQSLLQTNSVPDIEDVEYEFLAARRQSSDRTLLTALFQKDEKWKPTPLFLQRSQGITGVRSFFTHEIYQRIRADHFLAIWENKIPSSHLSSARTNRHLIGNVHGRIQLPIPIIPKGNQLRKLHVHLIPAALGKTRWSGNSDVDTFSSPTFISPIFLSDFPDSIDFSFPTTLPGAYYLKAVWDSRAPFSNETAAGAGDYETDFIPFTLKPAGEIKLLAQCTNQIRGGENYYKADATTRAQWKSGNLPIENYVTFAGRPHFTCSLDKWLLQTNLVSDIAVKRLSFVFAPGKTNPPDLVLTGYLDQNYKSAHDHSLRFSIELPDKTVLHRAMSQFSRTSSSDAFIETFPRFPTNHPTFRLRAYSPKSESTPIFDLPLTNLLYQ